MAGALVIMGPTASGKTDLALAVARRLGGEIISADSAQVYRHMDIGTAKPPADILHEIPHHLIDVRAPSDPYSAADFREDAISAVRDIRSRGRLPIIVGGAMLYLQALKQGLARLPEADPELRARIVREAGRRGWAALHDELQAVDPEAAARIRPTDTQRLQRAIEVCRLSGMPLTRLQRQSRTPCPFPLLEVALAPADRAALHGAIARRFDRMLALGFVDEVRSLKQNRLLHPGLPAIKAVGYRQIWSHLDGETTGEGMRHAAIAATRQLAKRQYTWLRSWSDLHVLPGPDIGQVLKIADDGLILE